MLNKKYIEEKEDFEILRSVFMSFINIDIEELTFLNILTKSLYNGPDPELRSYWLFHDFDLFHCLFKRYFIIDKQISRHLVQNSISNPPSPLCNSYNSHSS